jgi:hypothetical protein
MAFLSLVSLLLGFTLALQSPRYAERRSLRVEEAISMAPPIFVPVRSLRLIVGTRSAFCESTSKTAVESSGDVKVRVASHWSNRHSSSTVLHEPNSSEPLRMECSERGSVLHVPRSGVILYGLCSQSVFTHELMAIPRRVSVRLELEA